MPTPADVSRVSGNAGLRRGPGRIPRGRVTAVPGRYQAQGLPSSVINSSAAIAAAGSYSFGRQMGNANYPNCISAALAWHKAIVTSATGATEVQP